MRPEHGRRLKSPRDVTEQRHPLRSSRTNTYKTHTHEHTQMTEGIAGRAQSTAGARSQVPGPSVVWDGVGAVPCDGREVGLGAGSPTRPRSSVERLPWSWQLGCLCRPDRGSPSSPLGTRLRHHGRQGSRQRDFPLPPQPPSSRARCALPWPHGGRGLCGSAGADPPPGTRASPRRRPTAPAPPAQAL